MGTLAGWAAYATDWLNHYGPIAWVSAAILGALAGAFAAYIIASFRVQLARAAALHEMRLTPRTINPLEGRFEKIRFRLLDLESPITVVVKDKQFIECEILGPGTIVFYHRTNVISPQINEVDFVKTRADGVRIFSAVVFENCTFIRCTFHRLLVLAPPGAAEELDRDTGGRISWLNLEAATARPLPQGTASGTPPRSHRG